MCNSICHSSKIAFMAILFFQSKAQSERTITDLRIIYSRHGVDIDYLYNETHYNSNVLSSVPGCPKSISGLPWIYYGNPKRCYLAHFIGPCSKGEVLITQEGSPYGICGCECMTLDPDKYKSLRENKKDRYFGCKDENNEISKNYPFGQVFDVEAQKCYGLYTTGPCERTGEVITEFTGESIRCRPLCNTASSNWTELHRKRLCTIKPQQTNYERDSITGSITNGACGRNTRYSETLQKCIRQVPVNFKFG